MRARPAKGKKPPPITETDIYDYLLAGTTKLLDRGFDRDRSNAAAEVRADLERTRWKEGS